jgi:hypothetical protein
MCLRTRSKPAPDFFRSPERASRPLMRLESMDDLAVTNYVPRTTQVRKALDLLHNNRLYVSYDLDAMDRHPRGAARMAAHVSIYELK